MKNCEAILLQKSATSWACYSSHITLNGTCLIYEFLLGNINKFLTLTKFDGMKVALINCKRKLESFYDRASIVTNISSILDPRKNLDIFRKLDWDIPWIKSVLSSLRDVSENIPIVNIYVQPTQALKS